MKDSETPGPPCHLGQWWGPEVIWRYLCSWHKEHLFVLNAPLFTLCGVWFCFSLSLLFSFFITLIFIQKILIECLLYMKHCGCQELNGKSQNIAPTSHGVVSDSPWSITTIIINTYRIITMCQVLLSALYICYLIQTTRNVLLSPFYRWGSQGTKSQKFAHGHSSGACILLVTTLLSLLSYPRRCHLRCFTNPLIYSLIHSPHCY